eukprot:scaffold30296_cov54-Phaeocystis_antarctica.AAC.3
MCTLCQTLCITSLWALSGAARRLYNVLYYRSQGNRQQSSPFSAHWDLTSGCTLKLSAQVHTGRTGSAPGAPVACCAPRSMMGATVDCGLFSCISCLATWQEPIDPGLQQPPAALWRGCSLARAQATAAASRAVHERERPAAGSVQGRAARMAGKPG